MIAHKSSANSSARRTHEVAMAAHHALGSTSHPQLRRIACEFDRGTLVLRGRLTSFFHKQLAQETVGRLEGVAAVVNEIEVRHR